MEGEQPATLAAQRAELEEAIERNPDQAEPYLVYADWLQQRGDPHGELIVLQHAHATAIAEGRTDRADRLRREELKLERRLRERLVGWPETPPWIALQWRFGFVRAASFPSFNNESDSQRAAGLATLLEGPGSRFLQELRIEASGADDELSEFWPLLKQQSRPTLRVLDLALAGTMDLPTIAHLAPHLRQLRLRSPTVCPRPFAMNDVQGLEFEPGGLGLASLTMLGRSNFPRLERLSLSVGTRRDLRDNSAWLDPGVVQRALAPFLTGVAMPRLTDLGFFSARSAEAYGALAKSTLLPRLRTLRVWKGSVDVLLKEGSRFQHLESLHIIEGGVPEHDAERLRRLHGDRLKCEILPG